MHMSGTGDAGCTVLRVRCDGRVPRVSPTPRRPGIPEPGPGTGRLRTLTASTLPLLLVAAWVIFAIAWIWTNPLGAAPDEGDHYIRAVAAGHGDLVGTPAPLAASDPQGIAGGRRYFHIPVGMDQTAQFACDAFNANQPATCADAPSAPSTTTVAQSAAGTYMPTGYILPGALMRLASDPATALRLGRIASALLSLSLLAVAMRLLWSRARSGFALLGMLLVVTPQQVFLLTEVGPNGLEIAAATCFAAAIIRLSRAAPVSAWHWAGLAYGGVMLGAARPLGPLWVLGGVVIALVFAGARRVFARFRERPWSAAGASAAIAAGAAVNLLWQARYPGTAHVSLHNLLTTYWNSVDQVPRLFEEMVGYFGWLDTSLPDPLYLLWMTAVLSIALLALLVGTWRHRLVIVLLAVASVLLVGLLATYLSLALGYTGGTQGVQGRYVMPLVVWFPLVCGEVLYLGRHRLGQLFPRRLFLYLAALVALVQLDAWLINGRRYAVGANGSILFLRFPLWQPPAGWWTWVVLVLVAAALMAAAGSAGTRAERAEPVEPALDEGAG